MEESDFRKETPSRFVSAVVKYVSWTPAEITGSKSPEQTIAAMRGLRFAQYHPKVTFTIAKISGGVHGIDIARLRRDHMVDCTWTPTVFPRRPVQIGPSVGSDLPEVGSDYPTNAP